MKNKTSLLVILLFLFLPLIAFWRNFDFSGLNLTFFHADFAGFYFPEFVFGTQLINDIRHGKYLLDILWDPYHMLGLPLVGGIDRIGLFYPVKAIFYYIASFFPRSSLIYFATSYSLLHMSFAGIFTYLFTKECLKLSSFASFVAGLVYAFGGTFIYLIVYINHVTGLAFLPLTLYFLVTSIERNSYKRAVLAGFSLAPILLAGYFPMFFYNNMFITIFLLFYFTKNLKTFATSIKYIILANIIAILLSGVVLLPNIELSQLAERQAYNLVGSSSNPANPDDMINYFIPHLYGVDKSGRVYGYVGILSLILIALAIKHGQNRVIGFSVISILIFLVMSFGSMTFLHALMYKLLPLYGNFRRPAVLHYIIGLNLSFLVGYAVHLIESKKIEQTTLNKFGGYLLAIIGLVWLSYFFIRPLVPVIATSNEMIYSTFIVLIFTLGSVIVIRYLLSEHPVVFRTALVFVLLIDLFTLNARTTGNNSDYDPRVINSTSEIVRNYQNVLKDGHSRAYFHESTLRYHSGPEQIYQIDGYYGLNPKQYGLLMTHYGRDGWINPASPLLDMLGVKYIFTSRGLAPEEKHKVKIASKMSLPEQDFGRFLSTNGAKIPAGTEVFAYENLDVFPRTYLVGERPVVSTDEDAVKMLDTLQLRNSAVITSRDPELPGLSYRQEGSNTTLREYRNSYVKVDVTSNGNSLLILSDAYFPGWNAYIDGVKTTIYKANVALRGVFINDGKHVVEFKYEPRSFYMGLGISFTTLLLTLFYLLSPYKNRART